MSAIILRHIATIGWTRIIVAFLALWLIILVVTAFPLLGTHMTSVDTKTSERLARALADLDALRKQNIELQEIFKDISLESLKGDQKQAIENFQTRLTKAEHSYANKNLGYISLKEEPNTQYEILRRRIYSNTNELWYFIRSSLVDLQKKVQDISPELGNSIKYALDLSSEHRRSLLHDIDKLAEVDGFATWREKEANDLSDLVQERFSYLQNPPDCKKARKLVCSLNKGCGYGCQLHHAAYCFMVAYGTKRTLVMKSKGWRYHKAGWEEIFKPISDTCLDPGDSYVNWPGSTDSQIVSLPIIDSLSPRPPYLPLAIPEDLAPRLSRLHGDPIVWWVGQILKYLLRPQSTTAAGIQKTMTSMGFKRPIVGVHVRRTDKVGNEAAYHGIEEYMVAVDDYYNLLELKEPVEVRRIYLATDDPKVIAEARAKYPHYEILGDPTISKTASIATRYSDSSLFGIIFDIHMLSMSDFLVCTFSSQNLLHPATPCCNLQGNCNRMIAEHGVVDMFQPLSACRVCSFENEADLNIAKNEKFAEQINVCRVAYEQMQNYFPDASAKFRSLDDIYYYGGQQSHNVEAVLAHEPKKSGEMQLYKSDIISVAGNHWNGFSKGRNLRTNQVALFPGFKVQNKIDTAKFPTYPEVAQLKDVDIK